MFSAASQDLAVQSWLVMKVWSCKQIFAYSRSYFARRIVPCKCIVSLHQIYKCLSRFSRLHTGSWHKMNLLSGEINNQQHEHRATNHRFKTLPSEWGFILGMTSRVKCEISPAPTNDTIQLQISRPSNTKWQPILTKVWRLQIFFQHLRILLRIKPQTPNLKPDFGITDLLAVGEDTI